MFFCSSLSFLFPRSGSFFSWYHSSAITMPLGSSTIFSLAFCFSKSSLPGSLPVYFTLFDSYTLSWVTGWLSVITPGFHSRYCQVGREQTSSTSYVTEALFPWRICYYKQETWRLKDKSGSKVPTISRRKTSHIYYICEDCLTHNRQNNQIIPGMWENDQ